MAEMGDDRMLDGEPTLNLTHWGVDVWEW